jgi:hypothetical protein
VPAEGFQFGASVHDRAGEADVHPTPTLAVGDLVDCAHKPQARMPDLRLGGAVVEPCNACYSVTNWRFCASVNDTSTRDQSAFVVERDHRSRPWRWSPPQLQLTPTVAERKA